MLGILKFERDMLEGKNIHIRKKYGDTSFKNHWHSYYEIIFYKNCSGKCILNGKKYEITDNCLFFLTPADFHGIYNSVCENSCSINISFSENMIDKNIISFLSSPRIIYNPEPILMEEIERIHKTFSGNEEFKESKLYYIINLILTDIVKYGINISSGKFPVHPNVREAIIYLINDNVKDISLTQLAERFDMSPSYFSDLFHKETGVTFRNYVNELKIEYAKRLIENGDLPILDVCYESGFNSVSHFIRMFKKHASCTPSKYRKQIHT